MARRYLIRRLVATAVVIGSLVAAATLIAAATKGGGPSTRPVVKSATGALSESNSKDGSAIFAVSNLAPGVSTDGTVVIGNTGDIPGTLALSASELTDDRGPNGGALSAALDVRLDEIAPGNDNPIYSGILADMPEQELGTLAAGESRTFHFTVTLLDEGSPASPYTGDNRYQTATASLSYDWTLTEAVDGGPGPTPALACETKLTGNSRANRLTGTAGGDLISGGAGADLVIAMGGDDCVKGNSGSDDLYGGSGNDRLKGGRGQDWIFGGHGSDVILARGASPDWVNCGHGSDTAIVDPSDRTTNCEKIRR